MLNYYIRIYIEYADVSYILVTELTIDWERENEGEDVGG